jgi:beta-lactamase regulating signal transducer with metallopeptidase domain
MAAEALLSAIWQGALLAAGVLLVLRLLPGLSAAARSVIWLNVFVLVVLLHIVPAFTSRALMANAQGHALHHAVHLDLRWSIAIAGVWIALSLWRGSQLIVGAVQLHRLAARAVPVPVNTDLQALLADAPGSRTAELCASEEVARPSVLGFFHPRILVPTALLGALTAQELQQVVLHEMEHLRRADDWTNLLQKISLVLFPLNPVLLWVERRLCSERELACDDRVASSSAGRKAYALCLTHLAEYSLLRRSFSLVLGAWERRPELVRRVHRILRKPVRSMSRKPAMLVSGGLLAGALGSAIVLAHSPQLVNFVPSRPALQETEGLPSLPELNRALGGGTTQLVKAAMPSQTDQPAHRPALLRSAALKHTENKRPPASRVASLRPLPAPLSNPDQRALVVLTQWRIYQPPPRVVLAVSSDRRVMPAVVIPATFAIVPTANGWLIIQI